MAILTAHNDVTYRIDPGTIIFNSHQQMSPVVSLCNVKYLHYLDQFFSARLGNVSHAQIPHVLLDDQVPNETASCQRNESIVNGQRPQSLVAGSQSSDEEEEGHNGTDVPRYLFLNVSVATSAVFRLEYNIRLGRCPPLPWCFIHKAVDGVRRIARPSD